MRSCEVLCGERAVHRVAPGGSALGWTSAGSDTAIRRDDVTCLKCTAVPCALSCCVQQLRDG